MSHSWLKHSCRWSTLWFWRKNFDTRATASRTTVMEPDFSTAPVNTETSFSRVYLAQYGPCVVALNKIGTRTWRNDFLSIGTMEVSSATWPSNGPTLASREVATRDHAAACMAKRSEFAWLRAAPTPAPCP